MRLALTERRKMECDGYLFPSDYYDIPGVEEFQDLEAVREYACEKLSPYRGEAVDLYLNGGLTIETLTAIWAARKLDISLALWHYDREKDRYVRQELKWRPVPAGRGAKEAAEAIYLCRGRHWGSEENCIFDAIPQDRIFDFQWQEEQAEEVLRDYSHKKIAVYVSGLTSAAVSVLNAAAKEQVSVLWMHHDYDREEYFPQSMEE